MAGAAVFLFTQGDVRDLLKASLTLLKDACMMAATDDGAADVMVADSTFFGGTYCGDGLPFIIGLEPTYWESRAVCGLVLPDDAMVVAAMTSSQESRQVLVEVSRFLAVSLNAHVNVGTQEPLVCVTGCCLLAATATECSADYPYYEYILTPEWMAAHADDLIPVLAK